MVVHGLAGGLRPPGPPVSAQHWVDFWNSQKCALWTFSHDTMNHTVALHLAASTLWTTGSLSVKNDLGASHLFLFGCLFCFYLVVLGFFLAQL